MQELKDKFVGKYVGPNKIKDIDVTSIKTPSGGMVFTLAYEDGRFELFPEKGLVAVVSDGAKDFNHLRDARVDIMVPEIMNVIKEYDIPYGQFTWLMSMVAAQWQNNFNRANAILWFGEASAYVPGSDTTDRLTLTMADQVNSREVKQDAG